MKAEIIRELRSVLNSHNPSFSLAPDWVVLHLYEKYRGLPISRAGMPPVEKRSLAEIVRGKAPKPVTTAPVVVNDETERMKMRLQSIQ
jgi:hypothetical protein